MFSGCPFLTTALSYTTYRYSIKRGDHIKPMYILLYQLLKKIIYFNFEEDSKKQFLRAGYVYP